MRLLLRVLNSGAHVGVGFWTGCAINDPEFRHGGWAFLASFLFYQGIEAHRKGDQGWPETREFMCGMGTALVVRRLFGIGGAA